MNNHRSKISDHAQMIKNNQASFVVDLRQAVAVKVAPAKPKVSSQFKFSQLFSQAKPKSNLKKIKKASRLAFKSISPNLINFSYLKTPRYKSNYTAIILEIVQKFFKGRFHLSFAQNKLWRRSYVSLLNDFQDTLDKSLITLHKTFKKPFKISHLFKREASATEIKLFWYRSAFSFVIILILLIVPFKVLSYFKFFNLDQLENKILHNSQSAFSSLLAAGSAVEHQDWQGADKAFQEAANNFLTAQNDLNQIGDSVLSLAALMNNPKFKLAAESKKFLEAGVIISTFGQQLVLATDSLFDETQIDFAKRLQKFIDHGNAAVGEAQKLQTELASINLNNLPLEYQAQFKRVRQQADFISQNLASFVSAATHLENMLGVSYDKRYLLVFQNNSELRATGGFLGSYALVDIRAGQIRNLEIPGGGSYDTEGAMTVRVVAPRPLWLVDTLWHFWDANWWPDWSKTARNLMWFYENSGGSTVDGVISLTPDVIEDLLRITGPIDLMAEHGLIVDADNFWSSVQTVVERDNISEEQKINALNNLTDQSPALTLTPANPQMPLTTTLPLEQGLDTNSDNKPKKIIGDLTVRILEILPSKLDKNNLLKIVALFEENLAAKNILFYFNDEELQSEVNQRNWGGEIKSTPDDYLMVVNTNIAGQKTDRVMEEIINHVSEVAEDGSIINTVTINRIHKGFKNDLFTGVRNVNWMRIYVPLGSELISATGFIAPEEEYLQERPEETWQEHRDLQAENNAAQDVASQTLIYEESGKTVFANWLMVDPGEGQTVTLKYRLPFNFYEDKAPANLWDKLNKAINPNSGELQPYSLLVQKQAGAKASYISSRLTWSKKHEALWSYPEKIATYNGWSVGDALTSDKYWSILIEKNN